MWRIAIVIVFVALLPITQAWAAEVEGKIQTIDRTERTLTLDSGAKLWLPDGTVPDGLKEGDEVKASYEERDGKNVLTGLEVK